MARLVLRSQTNSGVGQIVEVHRARRVCGIGLVSGAVDLRFRSSNERVKNFLNDAFSTTHYM